MPTSHSSRCLAPHKVQQTPRLGRCGTPSFKNCVDRVAARPLKIATTNRAKIGRDGHPRNRTHVHREQVTQRSSYIQERHVSMRRITASASPPHMMLPRTPPTLQASRHRTRHRRMPGGGRRLLAPLGVPFLVLLRADTLLLGQLLVHLENTSFQSFRTLSRSLSTSMLLCTLLGLWATSTASHGSPAPLTDALFRPSCATPLVLFLSATTTRISAPTGALWAGHPRDNPRRRPGPR